MKKPLLLLITLFCSHLLSAQAWEQVASLPDGIADARHHPVTFSIDGYGYLLMGTVFGGPADDFMRYDPATDSWENLPDFPGAARSYSYGTSRGSKAYLGFGGTDFTTFNDLWEYDSVTEEWTELSSCPCVGRYHPAFIQLDDKIYMGMGNNTENLNDWWEYDIATDTWTQKDDLPGPTRHHPFYFGIDGIAYVGFGHGDTMGGQLSIYNDFYMFDPATDEWTQLNDFPGEARVAGTQFDYNGKGYVLSGDGDDHSHMEEGEFWEYDPLSDSWFQMPSHPGPSSRWAPGNFVIDNYVYFMCGLSSATLESDMMRFPLDGSVGITSATKTEELSVYPNPVSNVLTIDAELRAFDDIRLLNSYGQIVRPVFTNRLNVSDLSPGIYFLQSVRNDEVLTQKVVVQR
jgi:N-acetylneuraminic acid mutarotase